MPTPFPPELRATFQAMAQVVYAGESFDSVHESLCAAAVELVDGCDHASLMLRRNGRTFTAAASDETARASTGWRPGSARARASTRSTTTSPTSTSALT